MALKFYDNDCDWVIAESPDDASKIMHETLGADGCDPEDWDEKKPDATVKVWCDAEGNPAEPGEPANKVIARTAAEWIERLGRGYVGSTEW